MASSRRTNWHRVQCAVKGFFVLCAVALFALQFFMFQQRRRSQNIRGEIVPGAVGAAVLQRVQEANTAAPTDMVELKVDYSTTSQRGSEDSSAPSHQSGSEDSSVPSHQSGSEDENESFKDKGLLWGEMAVGAELAQNYPSFPTSPVPLKNLRMCDRAYYVPLKAAFDCPSDASCLECYHRNTKRNNAITNEFDSVVSKRADFLEMVMQIPREVVLMTVNAGQTYLLLNWYRSVKKNVPELDPCAFTMVIATDDKAASKLAEETCLRVLKVKLGSVHVSENYYHDKANVGAHAAINNMLFLVTNYLIQRDYRVLLHDVDQVWLKDPFPVLRKLTTGLDSSCIYSQYHSSAKGFCNTGFVYILPTAKSKIVWATVINAMMIKGSSDQALYNTVLRYRHFREYHVRTLPLDLFNKKGSSKYYDREKTIVYHAVSILKKDQFIEKGIWYLEPGEDPQSQEQQSAPGS